MKIKFSKIAALLLTGVVCLAPGCTDYQSDINDIYSRIEKLAERESVSSIADQVNGINATVQGLVSGQSSLEKQLTDLKASVADLKTRCDGFDNSIKSINADLTDIKTRLGKAETNISNLQKDLASLNTTVANLNSEFNSFKASTTSKLTELAGADQLLEQKIQGINTQITTINNQINKLNGDLQKEIADRTNADNVLDGKIKQEIADRQLAISNLDNKVVNLGKDLSQALKDSCIAVLAAADRKIEAAKAAEELARKAADEAINIALASEILNRQNADAKFAEDFANEILNRTTEDQKIMQELAKEILNRENADKQYAEDLAKAISDATASDTKIITDLTKEILDRDNADKKLAQDLADEILNRKSEDSKLLQDLAQEIIDRQSGDQNVNNALASEITNRTNADALLNNAITAEANARILAANTLQALVEAEAAARKTADSLMAQQLLKKYMNKEEVETAISVEALARHYEDSLLNVKAKKVADDLSNLTQQVSLYKEYVDGKIGTLETKAQNAEAAIKKLQEEDIPYLKRVTDTLKAADATLAGQIGDEATARENQDKFLLDSIDATNKTIKAMQKAINDFAIAQAGIDKGQSDSLAYAFTKFNDYVLTTTFTTYQSEVEDMIDAKADTATVNSAIRNFTKSIKDLYDDLNDEVTNRVNGDKASLDSIGKVAIRVVALESYADELANEIIPELVSVDAALKTSIDSLCPIVADLEARMLAAEANIKNVQDSLANAYVRLDNLDNEVIDLKSRMDNAEANIESLLARIQSIEFVPDCADCFATVNYVFSPDSVLFKSAPSYITYKVYPANLADTLAAAVNAMVAEEGSLNAFFDVVPVKDRNNKLFEAGEEEVDPLATSLNILGAEVSDRTEGAVKFTVKGENADAFYLYWMLASLDAQARESFINYYFGWTSDYINDDLYHDVIKALSLVMDFIRNGEVEIRVEPNRAREPKIVTIEDLDALMEELLASDFASEAPIRGIANYLDKLVDLVQNGYRYASCFVLESNANGNVMTSEYNVWAGNVTTIILDDFKKLTPEGEWIYLNEVDCHETPYTNQDEHVLCDSIAPFVMVSQQGGKTASLPLNDVEKELGIDLGIEFISLDTIRNKATDMAVAGADTIAAYSNFKADSVHFSDWAVENLRKEKLSSPDKAKKAIGSYECVNYIAYAPGFPIFKKTAEVHLYVTKEKANVNVNLDPIKWSYIKDVATDAAIFHGTADAKYSRLGDYKIGVPVASIDMSELTKIGVSIEDFDPSNPALDSARVCAYDPVKGIIDEDWKSVGNTTLKSLGFNAAHDTLYIGIDSLLWDKHYEFFYTCDLDMAEIKIKGAFNTIDRNRDTVKISYKDASAVYHKDVKTLVNFCVEFSDMPHIPANLDLGSIDASVTDTVSAVPATTNAILALLQHGKYAVRDVDIKDGADPDGETIALYRKDNLDDHSLESKAAAWYYSDGTANLNANFYHEIGTDLAYGKDTTLNDTTHTYYGQVIVLQGKFHYEAPKYDFRHITWYVFDPVTAANGYAVKDTLGAPTGSVAPFFTKVEPDYGGQAAKWELSHFEVKAVNLPEAFKIVNEEMVTDTTQIKKDGIVASFRFKTVTEKGVTAPFVPFCNRPDETVYRTTTNITISDDGKYLLDYHGWDEQVPVYGELAVKNSDGSLWKFPTSFDEGFKCIYSDKITDASKDLTVGRYANYQVVKFNPLHNFSAQAAPTMKVTNAGTYSIVLFENLSLLDQRYFDPDDRYSVEFYSSYTKTNGEYGTEMFDGGKWAMGPDFGFAEGVTSKAAYDITDEFKFDEQFVKLAADRALEDIEGKFEIKKEGDVHNLYFYYDGQLTLTEPINFGINASLIWDWIRVPETSRVDVKVEKTGASSGDGN